MVFDPIFSLSIAVLFAFVFTSAATHKVMQYRRHVVIVADYRVMPRWLAPLLAPLVIALEFTVAILVPWPAWRTPGLMLAAGLLLVYLFSIGLNLLRGRTSIDCGCGWGSQGQGISSWLLVRNLILIGAVAVALAPQVERPLNILDGFLAAFASLALIAVYSIGDLLIANWLKLSQLKLVHG